MAWIGFTLRNAFGGRAAAGVEGSEAKAWGPNCLAARAAEDYSSIWPIKPVCLLFDDVGTPRLDLEIAARKEVESKLELRDQDNSWPGSVCSSGPAVGMADL